MQTKNTWILLRGLAREKGHWGDFSERMSRAFPEDEILALDLPGSGEHRDTSSPTTIEGIFESVRAEAIERAQTQGQFKVFAVSMGAMVTLEWMKQRPEDLSTCVLVNTSLKGVNPIYYRLRWQAWNRLLRILSQQNPREREKQLVEILINDEDARRRALPMWMKIAAERPLPPLTFFNQLLAASKYGGFEKPPDIPTLLLVGLGDRWVDPSCSETIHKKWGWELRRHPWGGHDITWDDSDWVIKQIQEWNR